MPRAGLSTDRVVDEAAALADEIGLENLTMAEIAKRLHVRLPSLYKHVAGMPALRRQLAIRAKSELAGVLARATVGRARSDALRALGLAYREWALAHPGGYSASVRAPFPGDAEDEEASAANVQIVFDVLAGYGLSDDALVDATRSLRAGLHGFMLLERAGAFALDRAPEDSFSWMIDSLDTAMASTTP
ncbi:MAG: WHG domain-containing protein [Propionibacteriales bacterium]|nr:WHG domain-containing protein [Propionibacteriales bacterium]